MQDYVLWGGIFLAGFLILALAVFFLVRKISKFSIIIKTVKGKQRSAYVLSAALIAIVFVVLTLIMGMVTAAITVIHILGIWLITDVINVIFGRKLKEEIVFAASLVLTIIYLSICYFICVNVVETDYSVRTDKNIGSLRIVQFADSHLGTVFDGKELENYVREINKLNPDVVVITGDFIDDNSTREDMVDGCAALSELETEYGVYFCFGNHDKGYSDDNHRGYTADEFTDELEKNGVVVLQDDSVLIDDRFYVVGRKDKSAATREDGREDIDKLIEPLDSSKYIIVLDHQPTDYDNEASTAADLVLSGHTHGGQMFPMNYIALMMGVNDSAYGIEQRNNTNFIVTSGIADWEFIFKSGCISEYVVIDVLPC